MTTKDHSDYVSASDHQNGQQVDVELELAERCAVSATRDEVYMTPLNDEAKISGNTVADILCHRFSRSSLKRISERPWQPCMMMTVSENTGAVPKHTSAQHSITMASSLTSADHAPAYRSIRRARWPSAFLPDRRHSDHCQSVAAP